MILNTKYYSTKFEHYYKIYDKVLPKRPKCLVEIGVNHGGSIEHWHRTYPAAVIVGIDVDERCVNIERMNPYRIKFLHGSQADKGFLLNSFGTLPTPSIIIDDGSHWPPHQIQTFKTLFPMLEDGGVYIIEDTIVSYNWKWKLIQMLSPKYNLQRFFTKIIHRLNTDQYYNIKSVEFYPWMIVVTKGSYNCKRIQGGLEDCKTL